jgi:hemoglobin
MVAKHLGRHLTDEQRKHWMALLLDTADQLKLPDDPEFRSALVGYLEWGSRLAVLNSATTENPINELLWSGSTGSRRPEAGADNARLLAT